jgi:C4-dicarboxylate-specific signal transduction histidine kinase
LVLALLLTAAALSTLVWLRGRLVAEEQATLENAVRVFERSNVLLRPENDAIRFTLVESTAGSFEASDLVASLLVGKNTHSGREVLVHPFWYELEHPAWREETAAWRRLTVGPEENPSGWLYVKLEPSNRQAVDRTIAAFGVFLLVCLGLLVFRQRGKDIELSRTVSELEQRRAEVIRLERLALAGQLSANIFHDIKKPVLNIKHEADDLLAGGELGDTSRVAIAAMKEQTELFLAMLRESGFEQFVRAEGAAEEFCDVAESIERSLALVKYEQRDVAVSVNAPRDGSLPLVFAPPWRLVQLFSNLFLNAYQAMEGRGELAVAVRAVKSGTEIVVADTGPGIAPEIRARVFDPFATTKAETEGSGLGLYICTQILSDLGGSIRIEDNVPRGTRFVVQLPGAAPES